MTDDRLIPTRGAFDGKALCTDYDAIWFGVLQLLVATEPVSRAATIFWGLALHRTGTVEAVGQWLAQNDSRFEWQEVAFDLAMRGTKRIRCLAGGVANDIGADFLPSISSYAAVPHGAIPGGTTKLRARRTQHASHTEKVACAFDASLHRAVRRHRTFKSDAAALDFVDRTLEQIEQRLSSKAYKDLPPGVAAGNPQNSPQPSLKG